jgi:hypothetical protein
MRLSGHHNSFLPFISKIDELPFTIYFRVNRIDNSIRIKII